MKIACVGAGFSGAVIARELATKGYECHVFDSRNHLGGNCHTERDHETKVMLHKYGPHIFHTNHQHVWEYVNQFAEFMPFINRVKTIIKGRVYSLPINLMTINTFFGTAFNPSEAEKFIESISDSSIENPSSFEEQALKYIGPDLYEAFFKNYTKKQWGIDPSQLPASILKRLPIRFNYDDNYYNSEFQGIPQEGYTKLIENIVDHKNIYIHLGAQFERASKNEFDHTFYSGPTDRWFNYCEGELGYRTLDFSSEVHHGDYQGNAVINYGCLEKPYTRISEHKHFAPWENHDKTIIYKEYSRTCERNDIPYYPIRLTADKQILSNYEHLTKKENNVSFVGRLGTYRYLDMDVTVNEALSTAQKFIFSHN